jgi:1-acyl-sn-glycerol-3-phosphate acyltransferase
MGWREVVGFDPEGWHEADLSQPDPDRLRRVTRAFLPVSRYFRTRIDHVERIPAGGALMVGNHSTWGIDSFALMPALYDLIERPIRGLGDKILFATPLGRSLFHATGAVPGDRSVAYEMLGRGELCLCYPGGDKDSFKRWWERHTLKWERRTGFLRIAMATGAPIVPVFGVGTDDAFPVIGQERVVFRRLLGSRRYDLPVFITGAGLGIVGGPLNVPLPTRFRFEVCEPIYFDLSDEERAAVRRDDPAIEPLVAELHAETWARCQATLDALVQRHDPPYRARLARQLGRWLSPP